MKIARFKFCRIGIAIKVKNFVLDLSGKCMSKEYILTNKKDNMKKIRKEIDLIDDIDNEDDVEIEINK